MINSPYQVIIYRIASIFNILSSIGHDQKQELRMEQLKRKRIFMINDNDSSSVVWPYFHVTE